jgi:hypothetical protein
MDLKNKYFGSKLKFTSSYLHEAEQSPVQDINGHSGSQEIVF